MCQSVISSDFSTREFKKKKKKKMNNQLLIGFFLIIRNYSRGRRIYKSTIWKFQRWTNGRTINNWRWNGASSDGETIGLKRGGLPALRAFTFSRTRVFRSIPCFSGIVKRQFDFPEFFSSLLSPALFSARRKKNPRVRILGTVFHLSIDHTPRQFNLSFYRCTFIL